MNPADGFAPDRRPRWQLGVALLIGVVVAFALRGCAHTTPPTARASSHSGAGPRRMVAGVPNGFAPTRAGARAAAAGYVTTGQAMLDAGPLGAGDAMRVMAAQRSADAQVQALLNRLAGLQAKLAAGRGPVRYWQAVLATRLDTYRPRHARVVVWSVGVLVRRGVAAPQAGWSSSTFALVWEHQDWKIASEQTRTGPTPMLNLGAHPSPPAQFDAALRGFDPWSTRGS